MGSGMSQQQHVAARAFFQSVDKDGNGVISFGELMDAFHINEKQAKRLIVAVDTDNNKRLSYDEFLAAFEHRYKPVFAEIDGNSSGSVSHEEFVAFCLANGATDKADIERFLKESDVDGSGQLDLFEFCRALLKIGV